MLAIVECKADVDAIIYDLIKHGPLQTGPIAQWKESGEIIQITGRYRSKSLYQYAVQVRWVTDNTKGFFARGLTEIRRRTPVNQLPWAK